MSFFFPPQAEAAKQLTLRKSMAVDTPPRLHPRGTLASAVGVKTCGRGREETKREDDGRECAAGVGALTPVTPQSSDVKCMDTLQLLDLCHTFIGRLVTKSV